MAGKGHGTVMDGNIRTDYGKDDSDVGSAKAGRLGKFGGGVDNVSDSMKNTRDFTPKTMK